MKKWVPAAIAIALIFVIVGACAGIKLYEKYSYSKEKADMSEIYGITEEDDVPIILQDELIAEKGKVLDSYYYVDMETLQKYLNDRFYADSNEGLFLYTTPTQIIQSTIGTKEYLADGESHTEDYLITRYEGDKLYVALEYVKKFTNFSYEPFLGPNRMQLTTAWEPRQVADIKKDTAVRYQGGVKSPVVSEIDQSDRVTVLEEMDKWVKVKTADAFIGYVEKKYLENRREELPTPVTAYEEPEYTSIRKEGKVCLAWHQVTNQDANSTLESAVAETKGINVISPTWFALYDNEGSFASIASKEYVERAHAMGLEVWALIDNFTYDVDLYQILSYTSKRELLVANLTAQALELGIDGINVDFEQVSTDASQHYIEFIRELSIACRRNQLVLSVDNYVPKGYTAHYNRREQGVVADYVIIMGYDEHYAGDKEAGSVASIDFVEQGIRDTVAEVPPEKVINGIPFYTRAWYTENGENKSIVMGMSKQEQFLEENAITPIWDEKTCQNYAEATVDGVDYQVWLEDEQSVAVKLNIMKQYDLAGVACWKLTLDKPAVWTPIADYLQK